MLHRVGRLLVVVHDCARVVLVSVNAMWSLIVALVDDNISTMDVHGYCDGMREKATHLQIRQTLLPSRSCLARA